MPKFHRIKHTFTSGELSPRLGARLDFKKYKDGCKKLLNMTCLVQGPVTRRPGFEFIYDLKRLDCDETKPVRMVPFIKNEAVSYSLIFFVLGHGNVNAGWTRMVVATDNGLVLAGATTDIYTYDIGTFFTDSLTTFDYAQSLDVLFIGMHNREPMTLEHTAADDWLLSTYPLVIPQAVSGVDDWAGPDDWPRTVTFHQQRLIWGGNKTRKQTVWMSGANDFKSYYMGTGTATEAADPLTFRMDAGTQSQIQWLLSAKALAAGTISNEWTVTSLAGELGAITTTSTKVNRQTNMGSERVTPLMVGLATLFIERHGRTVNEFKYEYTSDSYETSDRSVLATHFTNFYSIINWTFQQMPDQVIWMTRSDGAMLGCTYQREHKVVGWHRHVTDGEFKYVSAIPGASRDDELWVVVKRTVEDGDHYYVEKMQNEFITDKASDSYFLDCHIKRDMSTEADSSIVTGLGFLEDKEVHILADGAVHPTRVVASGQIALDKATDKHVLVGLPYVSEVRPYLQEVPSKDGSAMGRQQRVSKVYIDLYDSLGGQVGRVDSEDGEQTEDLPFRRPVNNMGEEIPLFTGIYKYNFHEGYDNASDYFIRQVDPLPMTVRGVVDVVEVNE